MIQSKCEKNTKQVSMMLVYILSVYLPYTLAIFFEYNEAFTISLSRIGWRMGGSFYLVLYPILTMPFLFHQYFTFIKQSGGKGKPLAVLAVLGGTVLSMGALTPFRETDTEILQTLHSIGAGAGAGISFIAVTYAVVLFCIRNKDRAKKAAFAYAGFCLGMAAVYGTVKFSALFEVGTTVGFLFVMYFLNKASNKNTNIKTYGKKIYNPDLETFGGIIAADAK